MIKALKTTIITLVLILIPLNHSLYSFDKEGDGKVETIDSLPNDLNIHYTGKYCQSCHEKKPREGGEKYLYFNGDYKRLCKCHYIYSKDYIHPVGVIPSEGKRTQIPSDFPLIKEELGCITCHVIKMQCLGTEKTNSLRGAPFENRTQFCFNCHNEKSFIMHDVHKQINETGEVIDEKCLFCHTKKPDPDYDLYGDIKLVDNMESICQGCHVIAAKHSGNYNHMLKPSIRALVKMEYAEETHGIIFPLDEKGNMTCITCHNPHDKGVIAEDKPSAKGAGSKFRHRAPKICEKCHNF